MSGRVAADSPSLLLPPRCHHLLHNAFNVFPHKLFKPRRSSRIGEISSVVLVFDSEAEVRPRVVCVRTQLMPEQENK